MCPKPSTYSFQHYLAAKRSVDDRALNHHVWESLHTLVAERFDGARPLNILEIGGGIGTMVDRLLQDGRLPTTSYHLVDEQMENIVFAASRLLPLAETNQETAKRSPTFGLAPAYSGAIARGRDMALELSLYGCDLFSFLSRVESLNQVDLLIAHAFLDLMDIDATLPRLVAPLKPKTLLYFTINFDGATIMEPAIDPAFDDHIEHLYHRTMDERITNGILSGDSRSGRHLFHQMETAGIHTLDAGSSDWVVFPHRGGYPADEAYFLHFIVNTMHGALRNHPELEQSRFDAWIATRHHQIESGKLVYIAHQLDYLAEVQPTATGASMDTSRPSA